MILRRPRYDKQARFLAQSARFEAGQVHVPRNAPWLGDWMEELLPFPNARHDDQVDSTSQALDYLAALAPRMQALREPRQRPQAALRPTGRPRPDYFGQVRPDPMDIWQDD